MENKKYPSFFIRDLIDQWEHTRILAEAEQSVNDLLDRHGLILFFKRGDDLYGAPEESRLIFAKLKSDDDDDPMTPGFRDEAKFMGINLLKSMFGGPEDSVENLFGQGDIPNIQVCDRDDAVQTIMNYKPPKQKAKKKKDKK